MPAQVIGVVKKGSGEEGYESPAEKMEQSKAVIELYDENRFEI